MPENNEVVVGVVDRPNGEQLQARLSDYKGQTYLSIRTYYEDRNSGERKPGRNGINIPISEAQGFFDLVQELRITEAVQGALAEYYEPLTVVEDEADA